jgi:copper chaperone CopZ
MKKTILTLVITAALAIIGCKGEAKTETKTTVAPGVELSEVSFGVRGNCGMCKTTIETAVKNVEGVAEATWDVKKKSISISYDEHVVQEDAFHKAIAMAGYDTEKLSGDNDAYQKLPECCLYKRDQPMNQ